MKIQDLLNPDMEWGACLRLDEAVDWTRTLVTVSLEISGGGLKIEYQAELCLFC